MHIYIIVQVFLLSQIDIVAIRDGQIKDVFYGEGDSVPEFTTVIEYAEDE